MKHMLLLSALGIGLLSSCSTAFKAGQTPDDVYYSPGRDITNVTEVREQQQQAEEYQNYVSSLDDRYLRMKVGNRTRWGAIDDFDYWYDSRYDFGSQNYAYCYNTLNPYTYWNPGLSLSLGYGFYNPGYYGYGYGWNSPIYTLVHYSTPYYGGSTAASNITAFRNRSYNNNNYGYRDLKTGQFVAGSSNSSFGSLLKRVFTGSANNGTANSFDRPVRTFSNTPGTNSLPSSSAGGSSGGFKSTGTSTSTGRGGKG
ncbi:MAG: hypothetical protein KGO92_09255 [Bacteroidota bacterium]|nr:hypothetical protein [Bacteroidota bacterium]